MTILVATDLSASANAAVEVAAALARRLGNTLVLAHVFESVAARIPELADARLDDGLRAQARENLEKVAAALAVRGVRVEPRLVDGPPIEEALRALAQTVKARLLVVGTHGRKGLPRVALGSVAEAAVLTAECPVLVVPTTATAQRLAALLAGDKEVRVVAAVDRTGASASAVEWLRSLRALIPCHVTYVHLYWPSEQYNRLGLVGTRLMLRPDPATVGVLEHDLSGVLGKDPGGSLRVVPTWGSPGETLAGDAQALSADLLVMGTRQRRGLRRLWLGSTVHSTLRASAAPVLCVPPSARSPRSHPVPEITRVLAPTDLSDVANRAIPEAYALARGGRGTVHLCHVHEGPLPSPIYAYDRAASELLPDGEKDAIRMALLDLVPDDAERLGIETTIEIIDGGDAAHAICQAANRLSVDAICLGSHGRGGVSQALFGSVAAQVVQHAEQPVHIVRSSRQR